MTLLFFGILSILTVFLGFFPGWFDSPEFALAAKTLGVSHPSGHPLWVILANGFTFFPVGSVAFRTALLSAVCASAGIVWVVKAIRSLVPRAPWAFLVAAACALLFHPSLALQSTRTEVYALYFALFCGTLFCMLKSIETDDVKYLLLIGFLCGVTASLQPLLAVSLLPPLALCFFNRKSIPLLIPSIFLGLIGISILIFLPTRASVHPLLNWDAPETLGAFWKAVSAKDYRVFFHSPVSSRGIADFFRADLRVLLPIPLLTIGFLGFVAGWFSCRRTTLLLGVAFVSALIPWLSKDFYLRNPDAHAYVIAPLAPLMILTAMGIRRLFSLLPVRAPIQSAAMAVFLLVPFAPLIPTGVRSLAATGDEDAFLLSGRLDSLPPRSEVRAISDHWLFPLWYQTFVERRRPDVAVIGQNLLNAGWYRNQIRVRYEGFVPVQSFYEFLPNQMTSGTRLLEPSSTFMSLCSDRFSEDDPYGIRQAICAQTYWIDAQQTVVAGDRLAAIRTLEGLIPGTLHAKRCGKTLKSVFPFPLYDDSENRFLLDRDELEARFALLYMECGEPEPALALLRTPKTKSVKRRQIRAWLIAWKGSVPEALETLAPQGDDGREKRQYLLLTRAALEQWFKGVRP